MLNSAGGIRAGSLLRRYWVATIALGVFAGVAGGAALGAWGIARRTSTVYDRFVAYENAAQFGVFGCTEGATEAEISLDYQAVCGSYDYADLREFLSTLDGVVTASRWTLGISQVAAADEPDGGWRQLTPIAIDPGSYAAIGIPFIVEGRLADPAAAAEATINEEGAERLHVSIGDELIVTPYRVEQFDDAGEGVRPPAGSATRVTVVGITRRPADLLGRLGGTSIYEDTSAVTLGPGFWEATNGDIANYSIGLLVRFTGDFDRDNMMAALDERWPGRPFFVEDGSFIGSNGQKTVVDAIRLQTLGLYAIAGLVALAALAFAGQAVARQVRREWSDAMTLDAIGMTRPGMVGAAAMRAAGFTAVAVPVAFIVATAMSPLGPVGIGRAAETDPGLRLDWVASAIALPTIAACVFACAIIPVATVRRRTNPDRGLTARSRLAFSLPATGTAGRALSRARAAGGLTLGSAVIGAALASAAGVAAWSLASSYDELRAHPARYGSSWDAQVGNVGNGAQQLDTRERLAAIPGIRAVGIHSAEGIGDDERATLFAAEPFLGHVSFGTITAGRAPTSSNEIALARHTLEQYDVSIGDVVEIAKPFEPGTRFSFDVVGEVVVNNTLSSLPGRGGLLTTAGMQRVAETLGQTYVVWVDPGADRAETLAAVQAAFPTTFLEHSTPRPVSNLGLVSRQPALLALLVGVLAAAAMVHALVISVRRGRHQIGVLKTIGFTRRQVVATVAWHASTLAIWALVIGVPLGIIVGRTVWTKIVDNIGLVSAPSVSLPAILIVTLAVLAMANLASLGPGIAAARTRPAQALRAE